MKRLTASVLFITILLFAATGATAALAGSSLPDSPLYPAKLAMEQVQLGFKADAAGKAFQQLNMAQARIREINRLLEKGEIPGEALVLRLENHLQLALKYATQLNNAEMQKVLAQLQTMVQTQLRQMEQTRAVSKDQIEEPLQLTLRILERVRDQVQAGLQNGSTLRLQIRTDQPSETNCAPWNGVIPEDCQPVGDAYKYGQDSENNGHNGPGEKYGNPDCPDCEPLGEEHKYGQDADKPGPHGPQGEECDCCESLMFGPGERYGNPDCPDCVPAGEAYKYGQDSTEPGPGPGPGPGENTEANRNQNKSQSKSKSPGESGKKP
jgi:hypothetical protein